MFSRGIVRRLCEDLLDRVEVGRVGRQEQQPSPSAPDGRAHGRVFVARQVVHDDDVAGRERRHEALLDIVGKALPAHHRRRTDAQHRRHRTNALARQNPRNRTLTQIHRIGSGHRCRPPASANSLNQTSRAL